MTFRESILASASSVSNTQKKNYFFLEGFFMDVPILEYWADTLSHNVGHKPT
jgi:hypothetical protein